MIEIFGKSNKELRKLEQLAGQVIALRDQTSSLSDSDLRGKTDVFKRRLADGETLDDLLVEAFAVVRETAWRVLGMEHYPVQLIGGIVLHDGKIAEMNTGEGKTLVATLPSYLNALEGKGVHVVTVNDYLAKRDRDQMGKVHEFLGLSVGVVLGGMKQPERKAAYDSDITYVTNHELGFDYLRDNMAKSREDLVLRGLNYAIIDEVDSVLIDDARTPLIISGGGAESTKLYEMCDVLAKRMERGEDLPDLTKMEILSGMRNEEDGDFTVSEKDKLVMMTEQGMNRVERFFRIGNIADTKNIPIMHHMDVALRANYLMHRDKEYIVQDQDVLIVDANTGRVMHGRRFSDGLHQGIEAKEEVPINEESRTIASITYQSFFNKFAKKAGMTGTGRAEDKEFEETYKLGIVAIPTNRPVVRIDRDDVVFRTKDEKIKAICDDVEYCSKTGRPVLVGTPSVEASEEISEELVRRGIRHNILNAKNHEREAAIVAEAGKKGAVTIATNMAGRGTDIKLGEGVKDLGGLLVIGAERHDSQRVDGQLRGRAGRQGDPGESRFYLSLEDELMRLFGDKKMSNAFDRADISEGEGVANVALTKAVGKAQRAVESKHFEQRKRIREFDEVVDAQREVIYRQRRDILLHDDMNGVISAMIDAVVDDALKNAEHAPSDQRTEKVLEHFKRLIPAEKLDRMKGLHEEEAADAARNALMDRYMMVEEAFSDTGFLRDRERLVLLEAVDERWAAHVSNLDHLRLGINLVSYANLDPVVEYKRISSEMFDEMSQLIRIDAVSAILSNSN